MPNLFRTHFLEQVLSAVLTYDRWSVIAAFLSLTGYIGTAPAVVASGTSISEPDLTS